MGGEGANWIGESPFSKRGHVFQNLGDGTYNHSGVLALRFAAHTKTNITYKILYNDAVAMTGGQPHEGALTVDMIARQVRAEGVERIALVTDEPDKYPKTVKWPDGITIHHRDDLDEVQRTLAEVGGVSVLIYDQTCASEKRRRRKRGTYPDPDKRVIINELVCEGCGDCSVQSNCVAVQAARDRVRPQAADRPVELQQGLLLREGLLPLLRHRAGRQAPQGDGAGLGGGGGDALPEAMPEPTIPAIDRTWNCIVTGVGGTGVVTIGAILGMAAHLEGKGCGMIDMAGLAQKGGAVYSHVRLANTPDEIHAIRVAAGSCRPRARLRPRRHRHEEGARRLSAGRTALVRQHGGGTSPGDFTRNPDFSLPGGAPAPRDRAATPAATGLDFLDATAIRHRGARQRHRGQHDDARLRLAEGCDPALGRGHRAGDRAERRAVPMNLEAFRHRPARGGAPGGARDARRLPEGADQGARPLAEPGRGGGAAGGVPRRLPEPALCAQLRAARRQGARGGGRQGAGLGHARPGGGAQPVQAHGLQGRVRGRAPLFRRLVPRAGEPDLRGREPQVHLPPRSADDRAQGQVHRAAAEDHLRPVDDEGLRRARAGSSACAAPRSTSSATPPSGARSASWCATTRPCSTRSSSASLRRRTSLRWGSPRCRRKNIRGFAACEEERNLLRR